MQCQTTFDSYTAVYTSLRLLIHYVKNQNALKKTLYFEKQVAILIQFFLFARKKFIFFIFYFGEVGEIRNNKNIDLLFRFHPCNVQVSMNIIFIFLKVKGKNKKIYIFFLFLFKNFYTL